MPVCVDCWLPEAGGGAGGDCPPTFGGAGGEGLVGSGPIYVLRRGWLACC